MFNLEINYGICAGGCRECKFSHPSANISLSPQFTREQKAIIDRIVRIFAKPEEREASLSFSSCLSTFTTESDFVDVGGLPVSELLLYINSPTADVKSIIAGMELFLLRYPAAHHILFSFFRGSRNLHLQQSALQKFVPDVLRFLSCQKQIKTFDLSFGANDIQDMRSFTPLQRDISHISKLSTKYAGIVNAIGEICAGKSDDIVQTRYRPLEKFRRRIITFDLPGDRKFGLSLYREMNDLHLLSAGDAARIMGNTPHPNFHISPSHTFLYHHPLLARVRGMQVTHEYAHKLLDFYESGNPWPDLVQGSILEHVMGPN